ncbi:16S rRNA (guanine(966)-N(2))-methyltransferase RsmD [Longimicrobium sp.]|uniref:16S rRNA (guanine(966)-N(2))-methyltransferase RsmD n=1 Tax=Longimicrobium sp. TaxID=2029185 RepID=UPI002E3193BC|nr:16S rRNA (guanine(966)-N(2))-methyltransferase RsmD [Longimicrobium sp.]HEX6040239.1 16S rRNA (guanine(966)-N(2))-methyltransferase RsmD [Longimicrobium sp.]
MRIVAGEWGGRRIAAPPGRATRPTTDRVREAWMSAVADFLPGARVLDLFAGSGALGLEALSRGAQHAVFVEQAAPALSVLRANLQSLGAAPRAEIVRTDAVKYASALPAGAFDVAFADPPYGQGFAEALADAFSRTPFAALLCIEHGRGDRLPELPGARTRRYGDTSLTFIPAPE